MSTKKVEKNHRHPTETALTVGSDVLPYNKGKKPQKSKGVQNMGKSKSKGNKTEAAAAVETVTATEAATPVAEAPAPAPAPEKTKEEKKAEAQQKREAALTENKNAISVMLEKAPQAVQEQIDATGEFLAMSQRWAQTGITGVESGSKDVFTKNLTRKRTPLIFLIAGYVSLLKHWGKYPPQASKEAPRGVGKSASSLAEAWTLSALVALLGGKDKGHCRNLLRALGFGSPHDNPKSVSEQVTLAVEMLAWLQEDGAPENRCVLSRLIAERDGVEYLEGTAYEEAAAEAAKAAAEAKAAKAAEKKAAKKETTPAATETVDVTAVSETPAPAESVEEVSVS